MIQNRGRYCSQVKLRDYQEVALSSVMPTQTLFCSGMAEMECGLGKTYVAGELLNATCCTAVVVVLHGMSESQFVNHLRDRVGMQRVVTMRDPWTIDEPLPDALVITYQSLVSVSKDIKEHRTRMSSCACDAHSSLQADGSMLLWYLHVRPFGCLLLDEVHMSVADEFQNCLHLNYSFVYGMTGSLVREDQRIEWLHDLVGPILSTYHSDRTYMYEVITVPVPQRIAERLATAKKRHCGELCLRALNPLKVHALVHIIDTYDADAFVVFCDTERAATVLEGFLKTNVAGDVYLLNGSVEKDDREDILLAFKRGGGTLVSTDVCNASVDFRPGIVVVQYHVHNGSRQTEEQRCGRGSRGSGDTRVVHIRNEGTEEVEFVDRRIGRMRARVAEAGGSFQCQSWSWDRELEEQYMEPLNKLTKITLKCQSTTSRRVRHQNGRPIFKRLIKGGKR